MTKLPELVEALLKPETYPEPAREVSLIQTQMSWIFLAGDYVYKLKKPVNLGYLDYTTLEKRLAFCRQELVLNRRLAPETYLDAVSVTRAPDGTIGFGEAGEIMEYAVKMRRLPADRMMNVLLPAGRVTFPMLRQLAGKMAVFHKSARTDEETSAFGKLDMVRQNTEENFTQTLKYIGTTITAGQYERIKDYTISFMAAQAGLFEHRVGTGKIRDCHGDLHSAHVCFTDSIQIYDCIEFNDRFRYCDVASEIAFLAMDLDRYRRGDISRTFVTEYAAASGDEEMLKLLGFYKCYRAYVRGKVESFRYDDPYIGPADREHALSAARGYFKLADRYTRTRPVLLVMTGLMGTGKTTVANGLSRTLGIPVICADVVRKQIAGLSATEHRYEEFAGGIYTPEFSRRTYDAMFTQAEQYLARRESVILDASFKNKADRLQAKALAERMGAGFAVVECTLDEAEVRRRLEARVAEGRSASDGRWELFSAQRQDFDTITEFLEDQHIVVDTKRPHDENTELIAEKIWG